MNVIRVLKLSLPVAGVVLLFLAAGAMGPSTKATAASDPSGSELFLKVYKCDGCHSVSAAGIETRAKTEKMKGPDLSGFKASVKLPVFASYLRGEEKIDNKSHRLKFKGTDEELQAILDWLGSLEAASH